LAAIRLINRRLTKLPPFPPTMSAQERFAATMSERLLYVLMFILPIVGWSMLSAGHYPIVMFGPLHLPPILPPNPTLYTIIAQSAHDPRVSPVLDLSCPSQRCSVPHPHRS
jgi:cytochrome b561